MKDTTHLTIKRDIEMNRRLCMYLLHRVAHVLRQVEQHSALSQETTDAALPPWAMLIFGCKEGLMTSYIKLSQQHLKIAQMQVELQQQCRKEAQDAKAPEADITELSEEEIEWVKAWLQRQTLTP